MNSITPIAVPAVVLSYGEVERLALAIAKSGLFGIKTPEQAMSLMMIAQAEGRHPAEAARDYDVIQGRPAKKAEAMLRDFLGAGGKVEWHALDDGNADATFSHPQGGTARIDWNLERARAAGLANKDNWKKFPRQMLRSRVVSEGVRTVWPMATSGMFVPEEAAAMEPRKEPPLTARGGSEHAGPTIEAKAEPPRDPKAEPTTSGRGERIAKLAPTYDEDEGPRYPFATSKGGNVFRTGSEWIERWRRLIESCRLTDALDKVAMAGDMNRGAIDEVAEFDPGAAAEVREMIAAAATLPTGIADEDRMEA